MNSDSDYKPMLTIKLNNEERERVYNMKSLYRSKTDKQLTGLCGGIGNWLGVDSTVVRLIAVVSTLISFGTVVAIYVIASIIVPKEPNYDFGATDYFTKY